MPANSEARLQFHDSSWDLLTPVRGSKGDRIRAAVADAYGKLERKDYLRRIP